MDDGNLFPTPETPDQIGGNYEAPSYLYNEFGPIPVPGLHTVPFWEQEHFSYFQRRLDSSRLVDQCRAQGDCNARVAAWNNLVDRLKASGFDNKTKVQMVNAWVNEMIKYDRDKDSKIPSSSLDWDQTSFTTLTTGMGQCDDIALLKYETLRAVGIKDENMRLISGYLYDDKDPTKKLGAHEELMVNVNGRNYLLNNNLTTGGWDLKSGGIEPASIQIQGEAGGSQYQYGRFVPIASENEAGGILYYGITQDKNGSYQLSSIKYNSSDPSSLAQVCAANSCIDINQKNIDPKILQQVRSLIQRAHNLNPARMPPDLSMPIPDVSQAPPINLMPDRLPPSSLPEQTVTPRQNDRFPYRSTMGMTPPTTSSVAPIIASAQIKLPAYSAAYP